MPDWDDKDRRGSDEDAAWRDLVARFDAPAAVDQPSPWPDREDPDRGDPDRGDPDRGDPNREPGNSEPGNSDETDRVEGDPPPVTLFQTGTSTIGTPTVSSWRTSGQPAVDPEDEHFIPPTPPPLPQLQPLTKAAWLALFGGPAYLLIATALGWSMPGVAVFCAIAAFVGGVALLVLRLNDSDSSSSDDDNGAVLLWGAKPPRPPGHPAVLAVNVTRPGGPSGTSTAGRPREARFARRGATVVRGGCGDR